MSAGYVFENMRIKKGGIGTKENKTATTYIVNAIIQKTKRSKTAVNGKKHR
jgi:hypothetical protein